MKYFILSIMFLTAFCNKAQMDVNSVNGTVEVTGTIFNQHNTSSPGFEALIGTGLNTIYSSSLWMGGRDLNYQLKFVSGTYGDNTDSYSTGPLTIIGLTGTDSTEEYGPATITPAVEQQYQTLFIVTRQEVEGFNAWYDCVMDPLCDENVVFAGYTIPSSILNWPAHGDMTQDQDFYLAPFFDRNGDGTYIPADGDYPCIKGDKYIWFILNDRNPNRLFLDCIGLEIHVEVYAYDRDFSNPLGRTIFAGYDIINRSTQRLQEFYLGVLTDFDIGCHMDDYIGSFPELNSFFGYNGISVDNPCLASTGYGTTPPAQSTTLLNKNLNSFISMSPGSNSYNDMPTTELEHYNYLQGKFLDGTDLYYGGNGYLGSAGSTSNPTMFQYPENPPGGVNSSLWTEATEGSLAGDRVGLGSVGPMIVEPGSTIELDLAYIYSRSLSGNNLASVQNLESDIQAIQLFYDDSVVNCTQYHNLVMKIDETNPITFEVFPNPFNSSVSIKTIENMGDYNYEIHNIYGQKLMSGNITKTDSNEIKLDFLPSGIYLITVSEINSNQHSTVKIIKN